jgi:hypothetical protein
MWVIIALIALGVLTLAMGIVAVVALVRTRQVAPYSPLDNQDPNGPYQYAGKQASATTRRVISVELVTPRLPEGTIMA